MANKGSAGRPDLELLAHAEDLCVAVYETTSRSPKWHRFRLAERLDDEVFKLPALVIEYAEALTPSKAYRLHEQCRYVHSLLRMAIELDAIKAKSLDGIYGPLRALSNKARAIAVSARSKQK